MGITQVVPKMSPVIYTTHLKGACKSPSNFRMKTCTKSQWRNATIRGPPSLS